MPMTVVGRSRGSTSQRVAPPSISAPVDTQSPEEGAAADESSHQESLQSTKEEVSAPALMVPATVMKTLRERIQYLQEALLRAGESVKLCTQIPITVEMAMAQDNCASGSWQAFTAKRNSNDCQLDAGEDSIRTEVASAKDYLSAKRLKEVSSRAMSDMTGTLSTLSTELRHSKDCVDTPLTLLPELVEFMREARVSSAGCEIYQAEALPQSLTGPTTTGNHPLIVVDLSASIESPKTFPSSPHTSASVMVPAATSVVAASTQTDGGNSSTASEVTRLLRELGEAKEELKDHKRSLSELSSKYRSMESQYVEATAQLDRFWDEVAQQDRTRDGSQTENDKELRRLRILMRFSELKKDSDQLPGVSGQLDVASRQLERLQREHTAIARQQADYVRCVRSLCGYALEILADPSQGNETTEDMARYILDRCREVDGKIPNPPLSTVPRPDSRGQDIGSGTKRKEIPDEVQAAHGLPPRHSQRTGSATTSATSKHPKKRHRKRESRRGSACAVESLSGAEAPSPWVFNLPSDASVGTKPSRSRAQMVVEEVRRLNLGSRHRRDPSTPTTPSAGAWATPSTPSSSCGNRNDQGIDSHKHTAIQEEWDMMSFTSNMLSATHTRDVSHGKHRTRSNVTRETSTRRRPQSSLPQKYV